MYEPVAPFAGAWIETATFASLIRVSSLVAPFAGAWIETWLLALVVMLPWVAPFAGAWIETEDAHNSFY